MTPFDALKSTGLKTTLPRLKILTLFHQAAQRHLTADDDRRRHQMVDRSKGWVVRDHTLVLYGLCADCAREN